MRYHRCFLLTIPFNHCLVGLNVGSLLIPLSLPTGINKYASKEVADRRVYLRLLYWRAVREGHGLKSRRRTFSKFIEPMV